MKRNAEDHERTSPKKPKPLPPMYYATTTTLASMLALLTENTDVLNAIKDDVEVDTIRLSCSADVKKQAKNGTSVIVMTACRLLFKANNKAVPKCLTAIGFLKKLFADPSFIESANWIQCMNYLGRLLPVLIPNIASRNVTMSIFRKIIKDLGKKDDWAIKCPYFGGGGTDTDKKQRSIVKKAGLDFKIGHDIASKIKNDAEKKREQNQHNAKTMNSKAIRDFVDVATESNDPFLRVLMVQLATGARSVEVYKVSQFLLPVEDMKAPDLHQTKGKICVKGVAKKRDYQGGDDLMLQKPALFISPITIKHYVEGIRRELLTRIQRKINRRTTSMQDYTNDELHDAFQVKLNTTAQQFKLFTDETIKLTSHMMRKIYSNWSYHTHAPPTVTKAGWISDVLGHSSTKQVLSYNIFNMQK